MKPRPYRQVLRNDADREMAIRALRARGLDTPQLVVIDEYKPDHSREQQKFYRVICRELGEFLGYEPEEMAEVLKDRYLVPILWADPSKTRFHEVARNVHTIREHMGDDKADALRRGVVGYLSTTELNRAQMSEYIDRCLQHAADQGVVIETPEELLRNPRCNHKPNTTP